MHLSEHASSTKRRRLRSRSSCTVLRRLISRTRRLALRARIRKLLAGEIFRGNIQGRKGNVEDDWVLVKQRKKVIGTAA